MCVDTNYYTTFNKDHVSLIDVNATPLAGFTESAIKTSQETFEIDDIIFATGFDAMTGALLAVDIKGRGGETLQDAWSEGPKTYLGLGTVGFPNLFIITGPGSPSVLTNMLPSIEQHVEWISDCIAHVNERQMKSIEPTQSAQGEWVEFCNEMGNATLFPTCNSWYLGANVPGKPRVFMPFLGFPDYVTKCEDVVANGYEGFALA